LTYREDLQILRGLSVVLVVLYHCGSQLFSSGFLGVDVFFVISGFLMAVVYERGNAFNFLLKRAKRLLPAYFVVVLSSIFAALIFVTPLELQQVREQAIFSALLTPNISFWLHNSYFSTAEFKPLLHLWSLGVEVQFYLIVPMLFFLSGKSKFILPALALLSLAASIIIMDVSAKTSFFMMPLRLWEFLIGFLTCTFLTNGGAAKYSAPPVITLLLLICLPLVSMFKMSGNAMGFQNGHPGLVALITCLITGGILALGIPARWARSYIGRIFSSLGEYSYSIYLVHFPVITIYLSKPFSGTSFDIPTLADGLILALIIIPLSYFLYKLVETPLRKTSSPSTVLWAFPVLIVLVAMGAYQFSVSTRPVEEQKFFAAFADRSPYRCGKIARLLHPTAQSCSLTPKLSQTVPGILLVGDSHADSIKTTFATVANEAGLRVRFMVGNTPLLHARSTPSNLINEAIKYDLSTLVLHYFMQSITPSTVRKLVQQAQPHGIDVHILMPVPVWPQSVPENLYMNASTGVALPTQTVGDYAHKYLEYRESLAAIAGLTIYETSDVLCAPDCRLVTDTGEPIYFDRDHLTLSGSRLLRPRMNEMISLIATNKKVQAIN
jgi:peptidoglycan/LPS O-acetylase OafA/YrhL